MTPNRAKFSLKSLFVFIVLAAVAAWSAGRYVRRDREVQFQDPNLQWAVRRGVSWQPTIRKRDLARLTALEITPSATMQGRRHPLQDQPIINLEGIEQCTNLRRLTFEYLRLADSAPLARLKHLEVLQFELCEIDDLAAIEQCENLRTLRLSGVNCPLPKWGRLRQLERLEIPMVRPGQITSLGESANLRELYLTGDLGDDFSPLAKLADLRVLELTRNSQQASSVVHEDLTPFAGLTKLRRLSLVGCGRFDETSLEIAPLANLTRLVQLRLADNGIEDLAPLARLKKLRELSLCANHVSDLGPLKNLERLECLYLDSNRIADVSALSNLSNLRWLSLGHNQIRDIEPLADLTKMRTLLLDNNQVRDISALSGLTHLGDNAGGNYADWDLFHRKSPRGYSRGNRDAWVGWLNLSNNSISDIAAMAGNAGLSEGDYVDIKGNPLNPATAPQAIQALQDRGVTVVVDKVTEENVSLSEDQPAGAN